MTHKAKGQLIIIGGHEDKDSDGEKKILETVAAQVKTGGLTIITVATQFPQEVAEEYTQVFKQLGVKTIKTLDIRSREQAFDEANVKKVTDASVVFFTGGDQLRITSQIGDSPLFQILQQRYLDGITIAGTSAGAAAMPETMLVGGSGNESNRISGLEMAPGLAFISGVAIDTHFAERGRIGRILGVVAQNPRNLGLGIDEDTAIVVKHDQFHVLGSGAVYVADGTLVTYSSLSEEHPEGVISIFNLTLHVLSENDHFDLSTRQPIMSRKGQRETA
jgi:cyanophycinase